MNHSLEITSKSPLIEYKISTSLPTLGTGGSLEVIKSFEKPNTQKNINTLLEAWTKIIKEQMRYDALNFAIMKEYPIDSEQGGWIDRLSLSKLSMNPEQISLLITTLGDYKKHYEKISLESTNIDLMILSLKKGNFPEFVSIFIEMPSLQENLVSDEKFTKNWMQLYEKKGIPELLKMGIGNCKTLAIMSKIILEMGNSRWNLGIDKIQFIEEEDNHVTLKIYITGGIIYNYDPMEILNKRNLTG